MLRLKLSTIGLLAAAITMSSASTAGAATRSNPICQRLGKTVQASAGAQMYCFGPQLNGASGGGTAGSPSVFATSPFTTNVNAASLSEDVSPAGLRAYGQSETSIAAAGPYVVEGWNDATGFFSPCPSPMNKEELTGYGFSANGGASFTDQGGLPNSNCSSALIAGDPSVEAWQAGGHTYFYVASLYPSVNPASPSNALSLNTCQVIGSGSSATLRCGPPTIAASSTQCAFALPACSFLDKEYLSIDRARGRLYVAYTDFGVTFDSPIVNGQIDLAVCDIGTPTGGVGPAGGTAAKPVCEHGISPTPSKPVTVPYLTIAPGNPNCENEGAYPAVNVTNGDVYTGYEFNWATNLFVPACQATPTKDVMTRIPANCLKLAAVSPCSGPAQVASRTVTSMVAAFIPGYNRFPASDFPRVAVDSSAGTVTMVWNDARFDPLGDILMQSYALGTLARIQSAPVRLNSATGGLHFLPALRNASAGGKLGVSWYERASANTALTNVSAVLGLDPRTTTSPSASTLVTSVATDWNNVSSDIVPNFGDYTDNYATGGRLYEAWSDGRLGVPQPFEANAAMP
jgi:hypothetical protein